MVLIPVLQVVVQASAAFTPLQSAAGGLLKVMEIIEVRHSFSLYPHNSSLTTFPWETEGGSEQRRCGRVGDNFLQAYYNAAGTAGP